MSKILILKDFMSYSDIRERVKYKSLISDGNRITLNYIINCNYLFSWSKKVYL